MKSLKSIKRIGAIGVFSVALLVPSALGQHDHADPNAHGDPAMSQEIVSDGIINTMCPITPEEEVDPAFTVEYEGQTIGFCCRKCRTRFEGDPESYLSELPMLQAVSQVAASDVSVDDHAGGSAGAESHAHDEGESHDHAVDHDQGDSGLSKLIAWFGKFHPPATHLPIGLLIGAALAEGLFILTKKEVFRNAGAFCVVVAGFGALAAVTLGWFNGGFVFVDDQWVQTVHRWLGTATTVLTLLSVVLLVRASKPGAKPSARVGYRVSLFAAAGMVGATGFFGGALVYGLNHYQW